MTPKDVFDLVHDFFCSRTQGADNSSVSCNLLRVACMGNAEKTIQGELLYRLRSNSVDAVSENGYRQIHPSGMADRDIDIMVFDGNTPLVAIELKHYSPHQGGVVPLCNQLDADYIKHFKSPAALPKNIPLIQVGLFTEVENITPWPTPTGIADFAFYRFISAYVLKNGKAKTITTKPFAGHHNNFNKWLNGLNGSYASISSVLNQGQPETFQIPSSATGSGFYSVEGCLHWFLAMS